jgi:hypothetical protein
MHLQHFKRPATFQEATNIIFNPLLRKLVLVFVDDILVYSRSLEEHKKHLTEVFNILKDNNLFLKQAKCSFAQQSLEYLGHIISAQRVATDPSKIQAVAAWPVPTNVKSLRGFLGLSGCYRKFIKNYGVIRYKGKIWLGNFAEAHQAVLMALHSSGLGGHSGVTATYNKVKALFTSPGMKEDIKKYVAECTICQQAKT